MRSIEYTCIVEANLDEVWRAWTTNDGVQSFFAPDSQVELKIDGPYELYFRPEAEEGSRGSEGMTIQTFLPEQLLAFHWNGPPELPDKRNEKTWVVIEIRELDEELCEITLTHTGIGETEDWDPYLRYFEKAWRVVLFRFERAFRVGAINWDNPPTP